MMNRINALVGRMRTEESGAVMLLLLAGFLILFMVAMVMYDAGRSAQDKMDVQIAADTAAFSHSVVKARTMNMLAYANTIKRMVFSYLATYANAWFAILAALAYRAGRCFKLFPHIPSCIEFALGLPMVIAEGIEAVVTNLPNTGPWPGDGERSHVELRALERYQQYMYAITPWWAYIEGASRTMTNGAMMSASWPPPASFMSTVKLRVSQVIGVIDQFFGTNVMGSLPSVTNHVDALPVVRRDREVLWSTTVAPFDFSFTQGAFAAGFQYCVEYALSFEAIITGLQTYKESYKHPTPWKTWFAALQLVPAIGCTAAALEYNSSGYLDWKINDNVGGDQEEWLRGTGSIHTAYKPRAGRNDNDDGRSKFRYMGDRYEADVSDAYKNEGYFAMARSEIVYKQPFNFLGAGVFSGFPGLSWIDDRLGIQPQPDMWSPRWKAKNRPMILPGERFGSAIQGPPAGLNTVINDTVPLLALGSMVGLLPGGSDPFSFGSGLGDLGYLLRSASTMGPGQVEGIAK